PRTVRQRAHELLDRAESEGLSVMSVAMSNLEPTSDFVAQTIRERYPDFDIPFHSRWRHFEVGGIDRIALLNEHFDDDRARCVAKIDLAVISVLLDAGAGEKWRYRERQSGKPWNRSEGLALASFDAFCAGVFSSQPDDPYRVDAEALIHISESTLGNAFQVTAANPLVGLEGRVALLQALGSALRARPDVFGDGPTRIGHLYDHLRANDDRRRTDARTILHNVLSAFGDIWPGRITLAGQNLGDTWHHPSLARDDPSDQLMPFHKLSQWLAYSLIEPLQDAGLIVDDIDELTGLAEYRNGGLFYDLEVITPRSGVTFNRPQSPESLGIVEWRALTLALLDRLAPMVWERLGLSSTNKPLTCLLEGGTWAAGRRLAESRRSGATPPIQIKSDGTVF
ncbi:MAG: URC4/urg3 family protein, partial [Pseudomonadota bacterium]